MQLARGGEVALLAQLDDLGHLRGASFDATDTTPRPPTAIATTVSGSSPLSRWKPSGALGDDRRPVLDVGRRFLRRHDVRNLRGRSVVSTDMFTLVRVGTL